MCVLPKVPKPPIIPERQAVQLPGDPVDTRTGLNARRRRGMWASIFTSPRGVIGGAPRVTGISGTTG
jgi:hypothetical protein